jgi:hypothetical protein
MAGVIVPALCLAGRLAVAEESPAVRSPRAHITLVGQGAASTSVKDVTAELLARDRIVVTWSTQNAFQAQDIFERGGEDGVSVWIDLSATTEARLYFRDARADRFFIRALMVAQGIDEIAKEEIAHIVSNAVVALGPGSGEALTRSQARAVLHMPPAQEPAPQVATQHFPPLRFEAAFMASAQVFAHEIPIVSGVAASLALTRGPRWGRAGGAFGGWMDLGYQFAVHYQGPTVGATVQYASLRAGLLWETEGYGALALRFGLGAGADRVNYQPQGSSAAVDLAQASSFYVPAACL